MSEREPISKAMQKRCSLGVFSFALFIAFDPAIAAQIEAVSENGKPHIRNSSGDRVFTENSNALSTKQPSTRSRPARRYPWKTSIVTTVFWIGERPSGNNPVPIGQLLGQKLE